MSGPVRVRRRRVVSRDSRLDRWSEHAVRVGLFSALLGAATLLVCALVTWPVATGVALSYLAVFAAGLLVRDQRRKLLAFSHHFLGEEVEAVHIADNDADVARERALRISGDTPAVDEMDVPGFMADSGYRPPQRQCNNGNCTRPPAFAWETDGFPFAACNLCVSLWFEDGLPDWVQRLNGTDGASWQTADGKTAVGPACEACGEPGKDHWSGSEWVALCDGCHDALTHDDGLNRWADAVASPVDDDPADTLPRVLPEGRISD